MKIFRDLVLPVGGAAAGFAVGGPAGAAIGASIGAQTGSAIGARSDAKKAASEAMEYQSAQDRQYQKMQDSLSSQLANENSKVNSALARSNRSRRYGGFFNGEVSETGKSGSATLG